MRMNDLERDQRAREAYHGLTVLPGGWVVLRVDGRSFSRFTEANFGKPFDERFSAHMVATTEALVRELGGLYGYTESDEISVLLPRETALFGRSVEKLVSVSAGIASASFTAACGTAAHFDSRVWVGTSAADVCDYFSWRQADATRCCLNGWAYWALRRQGRTAAQATESLRSLGTSGKNELLHGLGVTFAEVPAWQRRGVGVHWELVDRAGFDPVAGVDVIARRRRLRAERELPMKDEYRAWLRSTVLGPAGCGPPS
jgi:tRNA(His) guanylyltransferase